MRKCRFIDAKQSIASYMVGFHKREMTFLEFNKWSSYLEKRLSNNDCQTIVLCGKRYLDELKREDCYNLFNIGRETIRLAENKTKRDLDMQIFSYIEVDTLLDLLDAPNGYEVDREENSL
ncbi:MAG: hypothetical protein E7379_01630 [Clostridiales bacterium]|nr:hypothetical protein [Clostridiales bacterium]